MKYIDEGHSVVVSAPTGAGKTCIAEHAINRALKEGKTPLISPKEFNNKIVFVVANAKAIAVGLQDVKKTPISDNYPGIDIQATNLDNILHKYFLLFHFLKILVGISGIFLFSL